MFKRPPLALMHAVSRLRKLITDLWTASSGRSFQIAQRAIIMSAIFCSFSFSSLKLIEQGFGLTSHQTHYRSYRGRLLQVR